jgi:hypothetical protein
MMQDRLLTNIPRSPVDFVRWLNRSATYQEELIVEGKSDAKMLARLAERVISGRIGEVIETINALTDLPPRPVRRGMLAARRFLHSHFVTNLISTFPMVRVVDSVRRKRFPFKWVPEPGEYPENVRTAVIAHAALDLGERGLLWKVRRCPICRKWFESRHPRKQTCSRPCKEKAYMSDPHRRARRKKYMKLKMRAWRKLNKERDERSLQRARTGRTLPC